MHKIFGVLLLIAISMPVMSQNTKKERKQEKRVEINEMIKSEEEGVIVHPKSFAFGAKLTTDGYGISLEWGRAASVKNAMLYQIEISERKHQKEEKLAAYGMSIPFIFGKINYFYPVKLGVQRQMLLGNKSNKNGVSVTGNYGGGLVLGLLRPYYVQVNKGNGLEYIKYNSPDSLDFVGSEIYAGPSLNKGWSDLKLTPGAYVKTGLRFDYGMYNEVITALEVGLTAEVYSKKIPQMVYNEQKQFFYGAYVSILFGKRK